METKRKIKRHKAQSVHYFENALHYIDAHDAEKASEFLWGSLTQALKATAMTKDKPLRSHTDIERYAREFIKSEDKDIYDAFEKAQSLHSNFYETGLSLETIVISADAINKAVVKLLSRIPDEN